MQSIKSKKYILFLAPHFFDYYLRIAKEFVNGGHHVDHFSSEFEKRGWSSTNDKYWEHLLYEIKALNNLHPYNIVLIIGKGHITPSFLSILRNLLVEAYFIHYNWDDVNTAPTIVDLYCFFDKRYTYSLIDSTLDNRLAFFPFFFSEKRKLKKKIDVSFVGSFHGDRLDIIKQFRENNCDLNLFLHLYKPFSIYLAKPKYVEALFMQILSIRKLNYMKVIDIFANSIALLEIQSLNQKSPTTRAIEAIGTQTKVITTCAEIREYDYFDPQNIVVVDRDNIDIDRDWLNSPFKLMNEEKEYTYSLKYWAEKILLTD